MAQCVAGFHSIVVFIGIDPPKKQIICHVIALLCFSLHAFELLIFKNFLHIVAALLPSGVNTQGCIDWWHDYFCVLFILADVCVISLLKLDVGEGLDLSAFSMSWVPGLAVILWALRRCSGQYQTSGAQCTINIHKLWWCRYMMMMLLLYLDDDDDLYAVDYFGLLARFTMWTWKTR